MSDWSSSSSPSGPPSPLDLREIAPGIFWQEVPSATIPPYSATACYWVVGGGHAWLVDAGDDSPAAKAALLAAHEALHAPRLERVIVTHWHRDHSGGARGLQDRLGARVVAHPDDAHRVRLVLPDPPVFEGPETLPGQAPGGHTVTLVHAPGHTAGQINVWFSGLRLLLAGDNVLGRTTTVIVPPDGHLRTYQKTLARLIALSPRLIGPGHGEPLADGGDVLQWYAQHRADREAQVLAILAGGPHTLLELAEAVYAGEGPDTVAAGKLMLSAHLEALMEEGRVALRRTRDYELVVGE